MKKPIVIKRNQNVNLDLFYFKYIKVMWIFFLYPDKEFSLSEIAYLAKVKKSNIGRILDELYKKEFITIVKLRNIWRVKANRDNWNFIKYKISYNISFIYSSGLVEFLVQKYKNPKAIILFGSFRNGEDTSESDIDIAIWDNNIEEYKTINLKELYKFEKEINRKIQIHLFNDKVTEINTFNNIVNGVLLFGSLEVKPYGE